MSGSGLNRTTTATGSMGREVIVILYGASYRNHRTARLNRICALAIFVMLASLAYSFGQFPTSVAPPPAKTEPTTDLLGRETPRRSMMGLLKSSEHGDYETAARYLQPTEGQSTSLARVAQQFHALQGNFNGNIGLLSDDPNGTVEPGLPPGQIRAGALVVGGTSVDVILVRVDDPSSGKIWLISKKTVASIPALHAQMESEAPTVVKRIIPGALTDRQLLGMSLTKWLGWLLSIPLRGCWLGCQRYCLACPREFGANSENFLSDRSGRHQSAPRFSALARS